MKSIIVGAFVAAAALLSFTAATSAMSENFVCGTAKIDSCTCKGTTDCRDMRRSGICNGPMTCSNGTCTCGTDNSIIKPRGGISGVSGAGTSATRPVFGTGNSMQSPPALKLKPILPVKPLRTK